MVCWFCGGLGLMLFEWVVKNVCFSIVFMATCMPFSLLCHVAPNNVTMYIT